MELAVHTLTANLPVSDSRKAEFRSTTVIWCINTLCKEAHKWRVAYKPQQFFRPFWKVRDELHATDSRIFAEPTCSTSGHEKGCTPSHTWGSYGSWEVQTANQINWPSVNANIVNLVKDWEVCNKFCPTIHKEPMIPHEVPSCPWEKVGVDYFTVYNRDFLLIVD